MKKRVICLMALCLFILSNTAFATNWVFVTKGTANDSSFYIDGDTAVKRGNFITFWELEVLDREEDFGFNTDVKKIMTKLEARWTSPRKYRDFEYYLFDASNNELWSDDYEGEESAVKPGSIIDLEIDVALRYAK